jgi:hypothetical protein
MSALPSVLALLCAMLAVHAVFLATTCVLARLLGARIREVSMGAPKLVRFTVRGVKVVLGPVPLTASIEFPGRAPEDAEQGPGTWRELGLGTRLLLVLAPSIVTFALAILCLGQARALASIAHALPQLLIVIDTTPLTRDFLHLLATAPIAVVIGVVMAKAVALNLLPLGGLAGGGAISELTGGVNSDGPKKVAWMIASILFTLLWIGGRFAWGLVHALL